mmetsp:Transcript_93738/g.201218  ORF Transcript_93738/g.201218 Transcript_93738/m.201218 type:complete len:267 (-) Transcript_93738:336-1136(-)
MVYSGWCGWMVFKRFSSRFAIFMASSVSPTLESFSAKRAASSSSSMSLSPSPSPSDCSLSRWVLARSFCKSFRTSWICRCSTTCRSSNSRDLWMFELISEDMRLASVSLCNRSKTYSRRSRRSKVSRIRWRSSKESCIRVAPTTLVKVPAAEGQRHWRLLPAFLPPSWPPLTSSLIFSCTLWTSARTATSSSWPSGDSSKSRTLATRSGVVSEKLRTCNRFMPSTTRRTLEGLLALGAAGAEGVPPRLGALPEAECETRRQYVPHS